MTVTQTDITDFPFLTNNSQQSKTLTSKYSAGLMKGCVRKNFEFHQTKEKHISKDDTSLTLQENNKTELEMPWPTVLLAESFSYAQE